MAGLKTRYVEVVKGLSLKRILSWSDPMLAISEIFGDGRSARFRSPLSMHEAQCALQAVLESTPNTCKLVYLVGEVVGDRVRIQCVIRGDGVVKRNYTCFAGCFKTVGLGSELIGSFTVPRQGKFIVALIFSLATVFAASDFVGSITSERNSALWLRGLCILLGAIIGTPYIFGLDRQQIEEITAQISKALITDG